MSQPRADRVDIDTSAEEVDGRGMAHGMVLVAVKMRGYLANSPRELTVPVEANQR